MANSVAEDIHDLIDQNRPWLRRVIAARTSSTAMVEDVFAEVLLAVAKSTDRPQSEELIAPWLCKIAVRQAALANRTAMRRNQLSTEYAQQPQRRQAIEEDPIVWLIQEERRDVVRQVLGEMDVEMRNVLIKKYVERRTYAQIGSHLGVADHIAEYRVARAKRQLRAMLTDRGLGEEDVK